MKVDILASGSAGNCIALTADGQTILVDAGVPKTKIENRLLDVGIRPDEIAAIFITHAHGDHVRGLPLAKKYGIPVYATRGEWNAISGVPHELKRELGTTHGYYDTAKVGDTFIYPFKTYHDAYEPVGYTIEPADGFRTCVVFDTGKIDADMLKEMRGHVYIIEANHDPELVADSDYPDKIKARVLSDLGHLSNQQTAEALAKLVKGNDERIYLTHLSSANNMPALALATVIAALAKRGFRAGEHYEIEVG